MRDGPPSGQIANVNGQELYFEVHGSGKPVILLHGFSGSSQDWMPLLHLWGTDFKLVVPDLRGHGRSGVLSKPFRHEDAAKDVFALLDHLGIQVFSGVGISGGGNALLHMATSQQQRVKSMVLVSATPYFPNQARVIMRQYAAKLPQQQLDYLRHLHIAGDAQVKALLKSVTAFADSYDDMNFTPSLLSTIEARTLIVQGDRDPLYPVELSVDMAKAIPGSRLWIIAGGGHGPVIGEKWPEFLKISKEFLTGNASVSPPIASPPSA